MNAFLVTYDLLKAGQNYAGLISALESANAVRIQQSAWVVRSSHTADGLYRVLNPLLDSNDKLFVAQLSKGGVQWRSLGAAVDAKLNAMIV